MTPKAPKKAKPVRHMGGWELYEYDFNKQAKTAKLAYRHDSGAWAILRPLKSGIPIMVFTPDGELDGKAASELLKLTKYVMRGTRGVEKNLASLTREGGESEAYVEYSL